MRRVCIAACVLCIAAEALAGGFHLGQTSSITIYGHDCTGPLSETIDCDRFPTDALWNLETGDRPQLAPRDAFKIALDSVRDFDFGPSGGEVLVMQIQLSSCGKGWVYLIDFSVTLYCEEGGQPQYWPIEIAVPMSGEPIVPSRQHQSAADSECP